MTAGVIVALRKESVDRNTNFNPVSLFDLPSLSARRAWIEILMGSFRSGRIRVALRKESVDRNGFRLRRTYLDTIVALRKESVDRNP